MLKTFLNTALFSASTIASINYFYSKDEVHWIKNRKKSEIFDFLTELKYIPFQNFSQYNEDSFLNNRKNYITSSLLDFCDKNEKNKKDKIALNNLSEKETKNSFCINSVNFNKKMELKNNQIFPSIFFTFVDNQASYFLRNFFNLKPVVTANISYQLFDNLKSDHDYQFFSYVDKIDGKFGLVNTLVFDSNSNIVMLLKSKFVCIDWIKNC
jgi:hypothetical protein